CGRFSARVGKDLGTTGREVYERGDAFCLKVRAAIGAELRTWRVPRKLATEGKNCPGPVTNRARCPPLFSDNAVLPVSCPLLLSRISVMEAVPLPALSNAKPVLNSPVASTGMTNSDRGSELDTPDSVTNSPFAL